MSDDCQVQIRICPKGHVVLCLAGRHIQFSAHGFRQLAEAMGRVVARLDALEASEPRTLH